MLTVFAAWDPNFIHEKNVLKLKKTSITMKPTTILVILVYKIATLYISESSSGIFESKAQGEGVYFSNQDYVSA